MDKIKWCANQSQGISIVEPDVKLSKEYMRKAFDALKTSGEVSSIDWRISTTYYAMYYALYAVLVRIGVKCEIHDCTIEFMTMFLMDKYSVQDVELIRTAKKMRIDSQYYVGRHVSELPYDDVKEFIMKSEHVISTINPSVTSAIRLDLQRTLGLQV